LERYNRWFWLQSVKTELELGLSFGTDPELELELFFKNYSKEPELGLDSRLHLCVELESKLE
jgi:hypothetical protein